ncbi:16S rRNA m(2)G 1207 methyltransferase [Hasllibacter halocynthiae]|uniref:16S rRNA m(2)G 1207 methyltransferase n=1 Tax=Hasllibacter halocynthiae TaxID=595589 RepID=A0A2T0X424_9RHOB|nr:methyltransferase [Hasllibacter halocynthiae]PRY93691.1 16S rRNA m(2)G 1207 methyltransferase [Hasllibacter halocynthiae]
MPTPTRLDLAVREWPLPEGRVLSLRPRAGEDLSPLGDVLAVTGFRPDLDALAAAGVAVEAETPGGPFAAAHVRMPRAREHAKALVAKAMEAVPAGAPVLVEGLKADGIEGLLRACRKAVPGTSPAISKAHGKVFRVPGGPAPEGWAAGAAEVATPWGTFETPAGAFSAGRADPASLMLAEALPARMPAHLVDLGAGWGLLSAAALLREGVERIDLVEAEKDALDAARRAIADPRARFHWADATRWTPDRPADAVICNPPFHEGRAADPALGRAFIAQAARVLSPKGRAWFVANRHLPYEAALAERFRHVEEVGGTPAFKLLVGGSPRRNP